MELKVGSRWRSAVCDTEVVVVRAPAGGDTALYCGGARMVAPSSEPPEGAMLDPQFADGSPIGKRFCDDELGLEVLVVKAGRGTLAVADRPLRPKDAKPLPASD